MLYGLADFDPLNFNQKSVFSRQILFNCSQNPNLHALTAQSGVDPNLKSLCICLRSINRHIGPWYAQPIVIVKSMPHPLFKTEIDAARVLLQAGWRPNDINGVLQFPLSEERFRQLGSNSLFFLVSDPLLATEIRPGAKQEATAVLAAQGWTDIEIDALLKPARKFVSSPAAGAFEEVAFEEAASPISGSGASFDLYGGPEPTLFGSLGQSPSAGQPPSLPEARPLWQQRRSLGLNRLLGLGLVIVSVGIVACILP